jgi:cold shock protein
MSVLSNGVVVRWSDEHGWGVLRSDDVPGDVWAHFSAVKGPGYQTLQPGSRVRFSWEEARQDEFAFRAVEVFAGDAPAESAPSEPTGSSAAFRSSLVIEFDPE